MAEHDQRSSLYMVVRFWPEHDTAQHLGIMKQISKAEMTFTTEQRLKMGQVVKASICKINEENKASCTRPILVKIYKVKPAGKKTEVSAYFMSPDTDDFDEKSRRKHDRIPVELDGRFRKENQKEFHGCKVLDLSRSGVRFVCDGPNKQYSKVELIVLPQENGLFTHMLHVNIAVTRCIHLGKGIYEIGGEFLNIVQKTNSHLLDGEAPPIYDEDFRALKVKYTAEEKKRLERDLENTSE